MDFVRALKAGFAAYAFNNAIVGIVGGLLSLILSTTKQADNIGFVIALIISGIVVYFCALWYFQGHHRAGWENGVIVGAVIAVFSIAVTLIQILPQAYAQGQMAQFLPYVKSILQTTQFWISVGVTVIAAAAAGYMKNPKA
jgi:riboflavin transporter FmnP